MIETLSSSIPSIRSMFILLGYLLDFWKIIKNNDSRLSLLFRKHEFSCVSWRSACSPLCLSFIFQDKREISCLSPPNRVSALGLGQLIGSRRGRKPWMVPQKILGWHHPGLSSSHPCPATVLTDLVQGRAPWMGLTQQSCPRPRSAPPWEVCIPSPHWPL